MLANTKSLEVYAKSISQFYLCIYCWRVKLSSDVLWCWTGPAESSFTLFISFLGWPTVHSILLSPWTLLPQACIVFCEEVERSKDTPYNSQFPWMSCSEDWQVSELVPPSEQDVLKRKLITFHVCYKQDFQWITNILDHYSNKATWWILEGLEYNQWIFWTAFLSFWSLTVTSLSLLCFYGKKPLIT